MKMHVYLSVVGSVMLLGFVMTYFRDKDKTELTAFYAYVGSPQRFEELGAKYAQKTRCGPLAEWIIYGGEGEAVMADGLDSEGRQVIKCVFDKVTGRPLSILRTVWQDVDLSDVPRRSLRETAGWWLKQTIMPEQGEWRWARDVKPSSYRYLTVWRSPEYEASLSVNTKTGNLIALRVRLLSEIAEK